MSAQESPELPGARLHDLAARLVGCFNAGNTAPLEGLCSRQLVVNSALLACNTSAVCQSQQTLPALISVCRARFPGARFYTENVQPSQSGLILTWRCEYPSPGNGGPTVSMMCTCRVRLDQEKVREIWLTLDEYNVLVQMGRVSSEPGEPKGSSALVNGSALQSLRDALAGGTEPTGILSQPLHLHGSLKLYRNVDKGIDTDSFRLEKHAHIRELVQFVRQRLQPPIDLVFDDGISQGYTTTFRGKIRARVGRGLHRYDAFCGFVSQEDRVLECYLKVAPPPTLLECLT
jgi:hypothetical protein